MQAAEVLSGEHQGEIYKGTLSGRVIGSAIELRSHMPVSGSAISWFFQGALKDGSLRGIVDMGEYGPATWTAVRA